MEILDNVMLTIEKLRLPFFLVVHVKHEISGDFHLS